MSFRVPPWLPSGWLTLACWAVLAVLGLVFGWNKGQLPRRDAPMIAGTPAAAVPPQAAADLQLYREMILAVRHGENYYDAAHARLPKFGFPIHSPLNWRLPTYAWLGARLPGFVAMQGLLVALSVVGLGMAFAAECRRSSVGQAAALVFLLVGVARWSLGGDAYLAQEPWAAVLILISLSALALERRGLAIMAGLAALFFRELALPYCVAAGAVALWERRWREALGWGVGIAAFFAFFAWHVSLVQMQLVGEGTAGGADLTQWLRFGGLDFVLLTARMNSLLFAAPAVLLWLYLLAGLLGLSSQSDETSRRACLATSLYLLAFAIAGRPENFYWGLMYAPLVPWGVVRFPAALAAMLQPTDQPSAVEPWGKIAAPTTPAG